MGVSSLPELKKDVTDRNRTSPFAFTGNKFEFRMVSGQQSIAMPNTVLNTIVADALSQFSDSLEKALAAGEKLEDAVMRLIRESLTKHARIIFNGDGYSEGWQKEAEKRGLPSAKTMVDANVALTLPETIASFERMRVLSKVELEARQEINYEFYAKTLNIEAKTMIEMAARLYIPAVIRYSKRLADSINAIKETGLSISTDVQKELLIRLSKLLSDASGALDTLRNENDTARGIKDEKERAIAYATKVKPAMEALRSPIDELEIIVDKRFWPVPTYEDLMFEV
jgi:glutamine synthetase